MKIAPLISLVVLILSCIKGYPLGITIDPSGFVQQRSGTHSGSHIDTVLIDSFLPLTDTSVFTNTHAGFANASSTGSWILSDSGSLVRFSGGIGHTIYPLPGGQSIPLSMESIASFKFTLTEALAYDYIGSFPGTSTNENVYAILASIRDINSFTPTYLFGDLDNLATSSNFVIGAGIGSQTGLLDPGTYELYFRYAISDFGLPSGEIGTTEAFGDFSFTLKSPPTDPGNHMPDAGSTLTLLGAALGGLGFIRRRI